MDTYTYTSIYTYIHIFIHKHIHVHIHMRYITCTYIHIYSYMLIYIHIRIRICICVHTRKRYVEIKVQWFFMFAMPLIFLDWEKISKTIFEKVFILIFSRFFLIWGIVSKHFKSALLRGDIFFLEISHIGFQKSRFLCWFKKFKDTLVKKSSQKSLN